MVAAVAAATRSTRMAFVGSLEQSPLFPAAAPGSDVYFSVDVETDGPIPGHYSMLSFGIAVAGAYDGRDFTRADPTARTFYAELRPVAERWQAEALEVNGLDRDHLLRHGRPPEDAMTDAAAWVLAQAGRGRPVLVAHPVAFDWSFLYWYFVAFSASGSPFGHASCLDIKTAYAVKSGMPITRSTLRDMPAAVRSRRPHTHRALDDAIEQADLFANIFEWHGGSAHDNGSDQGTSLGDPAPGDRAQGDARRVPGD